MRGKKAHSIAAFGIALAFGLAPTAMVSCRGEKTSEAPTAAPSATKRPGKLVDAATAGAIRGIVKLDGTPPKMRPISMAAVPNCAKLHGTPAMTEEVVPGENGALQNVVVYLKGDFDAYSFATPQTRVRMDQKGCVYAPHVVALMIGQPLQVSNSDSVTHNVHAVARTNRDWNHSQAPGAAPLELIFDREEVAIPLVCNMHAFMRAYVAVLGNPYFRVTGADGSFSLRNVPPGTYTLSAWHELYGKNERNITVRAKEEASVTITFKAVPGGN